jgi:hypothetical protein
MPLPGSEASAAQTQACKTVTSFHDLLRPGRKYVLQLSSKEQWSDPERLLVTVPWYTHVM